MKSIKKLMLAFSVSAITFSAVSTVNSCSKLQKMPDVEVKLNWNEKDNVSAGKSVYINVENYKLLSSEGYSKNRSVTIKGDSVTEIKNSGSSANDTIGLSGVHEGISTVNVSFVNLLTQQIASGSFKINVIDYSKIKIKYNKDQGTKLNPFNLENSDSIVLGQFEEKDWNSFPQSIKSTFQVQASNVENESDSINDLVDFSINENGKIVGKRKVSSAHWPKEASFKIKVIDYQNKTNFNDEGATFFLDKMKDTISLDITEPGSLALPYDGDHNNFNKLKTITTPIEFLVKNKDFDWSLADEKNLDDIAKNIQVTSSNAPDAISDFKLTKNEDKKAFELIFKYKEISLSSLVLNVGFTFKAKEKSSKDFSQAVNLNINNYRHGVKELDYDNEKRKLNLVAMKDSSKGYDFNEDSKIQSSKLINPFSFKITDSSSDFQNLKNNGYNYKESVVLTNDSFKNIPSEPIKDSEDDDIIQNFNNKIEQLAVGESEKKQQKDTGLAFTADLIDGNIVGKSNGIKIKDDGTYEGGEYFIVNKFIDDKNNYQYNYADFKWQSGKVVLPSKPIQIESHLFSMPISKNSDSNLQKQKLNLSSDMGEDTNAGTEDNPLMLSFRKYNISKPGSGDFHDTSDKTYRGFLQVNNIDETVDLNSIKVSLSNADSIATLKENPIIRDGDSYYINMTMLGQNQKDVKNSKFTIKIQVSGQSEYDYDVYYAAYAGDSSEKGNYIADDNISSPTSLYVAETALNRTFYLGLSRKNKASIKDVYFEDGYSYSGGQGALTTNVAPNKEIPDSLKNIQNVTFGGRIDVAGSYLFMGSFGSGIEGYLSFLKDVNFTSNNCYTSASQKPYDKNFSSSALLLGGNLSGKPESTLIGKKGINFEGNISVTVKPGGFLSWRDNESLSVVATTREMDCGNITVNGTTNFDINSKGIRDAAFIINENIDSDASVSPNQHFGNIKLNNGIEFKSDSTSAITNLNEIRSLVIDKKGLNLKQLNGNNDQVCSIDVNCSDHGAFISTTTSLVNSDSLLNPVIVASDNEGIGWNNNNKSALPNININNYSTGNFPSYIDPAKKNDELLIVKPILAWGKYASNQTGRIKYIVKNGQSQQTETFEYKNLNENYNKFTIL